MIMMTTIMMINDDSDDGYLDVSIVDRLRVIRPVLVTLLPPLLNTPETILCNTLLSDRESIDFLALDTTREGLVTLLMDRRHNSDYT